MTQQHLIEHAMHEIGFRILSDEPAGLIGIRKRVESVESGEAFLADIVDTSSDALLRVQALTAENAIRFDKTFVAIPLLTRWWGDVYCQILTVDRDWAPISRLSRNEFAKTPQQAMEIALSATKCLEYLSRLGVCHLAICPSTVYTNGHHVRFAEMWTMEHANGQSYCLPGIGVDPFKFIRNDPRLLTAPEFRDAPGDIGEASDLYSLALLIVNLFSTTPVGPAEVLESDDLPALISQRCPDLNADFVRALDGALQRDVRKRQYTFMFKESVAGQAMDMGLEIPDSYWAKAIPTPWDLFTP